METRTLMVDEEPVEIPLQNLTAIVHQGDMVIECPSMEKLGPEETVAFSRTIPQNDWEELRVVPAFATAWNVLWPNTEPPKVLAKASLAALHSVGMIVQLYAARVQGLSVHLQYPETYLHPQQCYHLMSLVYHINPHLKTS